VTPSEVLGACHSERVVVVAARNDPTLFVFGLR
jgi:hypothetical protein